MEKYIDVSVMELKRTLMAKGGCEANCEVDITDDGGQLATVQLRLNFAGGPDRPLRSWTVALKLHNVRIDGVDHESKFDMLNGEIGRGWHRHHWDPSEMSAKYHKVPISDLERLESGEDFLIRALSVLKIRTNSVDHGMLWD